MSLMASFAKGILPGTEIEADDDTGQIFLEDAVLPPAADRDSGTQTLSST